MWGRGSEDKAELLAWHQGENFENFVERARPSPQPPSVAALLLQQCCC